MVLHPSREVANEPDQNESLTKDGQDSVREDCKEARVTAVYCYRVSIEREGELTYL